MPFSALVDAAREGLFRLGINPGGPRPSVTKYRVQAQQLTVHWTDVVDWQPAPQSYRSGLQPIQRDMRDRMEASLLDDVVQGVLYGGNSRDFESLRLGFLWLNDQGPTGAAECTAASVIRLLAQGRQWVGSTQESRATAPEYVARFVEEVAGVDLPDVVALLGPALRQWLIVPERLLGLTPVPSPEGHRPGVPVPSLRPSAPSQFRRHLHRVPPSTACRSRAARDDRRAGGLLRIPGALYGCAVPTELRGTHGTDRP